MSHIANVTNKRIYSPSHNDHLPVDKLFFNLSDLASRSSWHTVLVRVGMRTKKSKVIHKEYIMIMARLGDNTSKENLQRNEYILGYKRRAMELTFFSTSTI
jgi:hypothetical protein